MPHAPGPNTPMHAPALIIPAGLCCMYSTRAPAPDSAPQEIREIEQGKASKDSNVLKHAPHAPSVVLADKWERPYTRERAAFPAPWVKQAKFWPTVSRVDNVYGDRNLITRWGDEPAAATA